MGGTAKWVGLGGNANDSGGGNSATYVRIDLDNGANTIASPGGSPANGDVRIYLLKQPASGAAGTITFNSIFAFPDAFVPNVSTTNGRTDWVEFTYDSVSNRWVCTKFIGGYAL